MEIQSLFFNAFTQEIEFFIHELSHKIDRNFHSFSHYFIVRQNRLVQIRENTKSFELKYQFSNTKKLTP